MVVIYHVTVTARKSKMQKNLHICLQTLRESMNIKLIKIQYSFFKGPTYGK